MPRWLHKIWNAGAEDLALPLRERIYRFICVVISFVCFFVLLPSNFFEPELPGAVNVIIIVFGLFSFFCFMEARKGRNHVRTFLLVLALALNISWFLDGGMDGSLNYYLFAAIVLPIVFFAGRLRWFFVSLLLVDYCCLNLIGYYWPKSVVHFPTHAERLADIITGLIGSGVTIAAIVWVVVKNYDREGEQLSAIARELEKSREKFSKAFQSSPNGIAISERESGRFIEANQSFCQLCGYSAADLIGRTSSELGIWGTTQERDRFLKQLAENGSVHEMELRRSDHHGQSKVVLFSAEPIELEGKRCIVSLVQDITARKQAEDALRFANRQLSLIAHMSASVLGNDSPAELAQRIASQVKDVFEVDACVIRVLENNELELLGASGVPLEQLTPRLPVFGLAQMMFSTRTPVVIPNVKEHPIMKGVANPAPGGFAFTAYAGVLLIQGETIVGVLGIYVKDQPRTFSTLDIEHLQIVADHAAISLLNERHFKTVEAQKNQLEKVIAERERAETHVKQLNRVYVVLSDINQTIVREKDPHAMLEAACHIAVEKGQFRMAWIGLVDPVSGATVLTNSAGIDLDTLRPLLVPPNGNPQDFNCAFTDRALKTGTPGICNDIANDPLSEPWRAAALDRNYRAMASLPLSNKERVIGILNLYADTVGVFDDDELRLLKELAQDISFALDFHDREARRKRVEEALSQSELQLRQAQKLEAIGQLAGGVAHDFNNILTALLMQADLVELIESLPEEAREGLRQIKQDARRATDLTRQLLLFGRRQVMQIRILDLNDIVTNLTKMLQRVIREDIRLQLQPHPAPLFTQADPGMLEQVLMNLAVNARDAMPNGGWLRISTTTVTVDENFVRRHPDATPGRYVSLSVSDTGTGIPPDILPKIFEPFFTTKEPGKGTGLGLATVFGIVKQHHGWVHVDNHPGQGATFQIHLPAHAAPPAEAAPAAPPAKLVGGVECILMVEDEWVVLDPTRKLLERHGYKILTATDAHTALQLWKQHADAISLLFTDLVMPGAIGGLQLARQLKAQKPGLKVVFASGYSAEIAGRDLHLQPGESFIQKPFGTHLLLDTIRRTLDTP